MNNGTVLEVRHLKKYFVKSAGILSALLGEQKRYVSAVEDVSFSISKGQVFCVAGESGCGKTTLGRTILKLLQSDDGQIIFQGQDITRLKSDSMRMLRTKMQMIFQDPYESLDPRAKIYNSVAEPLIVNHLVKDERERHNKVIQTLELAGLTPVENYLYKYPHNLSGGERQRVGIATALILDPEFMVADEPTSMLDVSVQANLLNLLQKLRQERNLTYLFITHDLSIAYAFSDRLAIMYLGKFVEMGPTAEVVMSPIHPCLANSRAIFRPIPVPPPVIIATLWSNFPMLCPSFISVISGHIIRHFPFQFVVGHPDPYCCYRSCH